MSHELTSKATSTSSFPLPSLLRNSRSLQTLRRKPSSTLASSSSSQPKRKGFFRRLSNEVQLLLLKVRSISEEVFSNADDYIEDLFVDTDADEFFDKLVKNNRTYNSAEELFLEKYKKFQNLDKMVEYHQQTPNADVKSSTTVVSERAVTLEDIIRQTSSLAGDTAREDDNEFDMGDVEVNFHELDVCKLREEFATSESKQPQPVNVGQALWDYRRKKWLQNLASVTKLRDPAAELSIAHIPRESYVKIYLFLVDKGRVLKNDKRINLHDLVKIINAGWIADEKWERAAKGLP